MIFQSKLNVDRIHVIAFLTLLTYMVFVNIEGLFSPSTSYETVTILTQDAEEAIQSGNLLIQICTTVLLIVTLWSYGIVNLLKNIYNHKLFVLYLSFLLLSLVYSSDLSLSIRRIILFFVIVYFGLTLLQTKEESLNKLIAVVYLFGLTYMIVAIFGIVRSVFQEHPFFIEKYSLFGQAHRDAEILGVSLLFHWYVNREKIFVMSRSLYLSIIVTMALIILLTLSRTGIGCIIIASSYIFISKIKNIGLKIYYLIVIVVSIVMLYFFIPDLASQGLLRPETLSSLTGRTGLWEYLTDLDGIRPYLGAGFGAFWNASNIYLLQLSLGWAAPAAHNGFLDVFLNTGIIGFVFIVIIIINFWINAGHFPKNEKTIVRAIIVFVLIQNLTQGSFQNPRMFIEIIFWWFYFQVTYKSSKIFLKLSHHHPQIHAEQ